MSKWLRDTIADDEHASNKPIHDRLPWWELMVEHLIKTAGIMCIL